MTVSELIQILLTMPEDSSVYVEGINREEVLAVGVFGYDPEGHGRVPPANILITGVAYDKEQAQPQTLEINNAASKKDP